METHLALKYPISKIMEIINQEFKFGDALYANEVELEIALFACDDINIKKYEKTVKSAELMYKNARQDFMVMVEELRKERHEDAETIEQLYNYLFTQKYGYNDFMIRTRNKYSILEMYV